MKQTLRDELKVLLADLNQPGYLPVWTKLRAILSRHDDEAVEKPANKAEFVTCNKCGGKGKIDYDEFGQVVCPECCGFGDKDKPAANADLVGELEDFVSRRYPLYDGCDAAIEIREILHKYRPVKEAVVEVDSIGCCPKCGALIKDMTHEPLAVLADRKDTMLDAVGKTSHDVWFILINGRRFTGSTYPAAEQAARAFLEALPTLRVHSPRLPPPCKRKGRARWCCGLACARQESRTSVCGKGVETKIAWFLYPFRTRL